MKIDFYHEAIGEQNRFTVIGWQFSKGEENIWCSTIWFIGFGILIIFN